MLVVMKDDKIVNSSRNLAGVRRYASKNAVKSIRLQQVQLGYHSAMNDSNGLINVEFENGATFKTDFASFTVMKQWVHRWRTVHGVPLTINGKPAGKVGQREDTT